MNKKRKNLFLLQIIYTTFIIVGYGYLTVSAGGYYSIGSYITDTCLYFMPLPLNIIGTVLLGIGLLKSNEKLMKNGIKFYYLHFWAYIFSILWIVPFFLTFNPIFNIIFIPITIALPILWKTEING